ncbi:MAG: heat-inducible transcription repressor HrcA [Armatimonadetes bacterium]|nr:heat-inducible transcription repressor HrcA [Armatimonadota bacterium]
MNTLDARKRDILDAVIREYITTVEPVGSETVVQRSRLQVSSATIRNEMGALEEMGYLRQPHPSAGRIPTDRGYRMFVDALRPEEEVPSAERLRLRRWLMASAGPADQVAERTAETLARMTDYPSVVAAAPPNRGVFKHLHLIPVSATQLLAVIVTDGGVIEGRPMTMPESVRPDELERLSHLMSERLRGRALGEITDELLNEVGQDAARHHRLVQYLRVLLRRDLTHLASRIHVEGTANILKQPEFQDLSRARPVLSALEQEAMMADVLDAVQLGHVMVSIGSENKYPEMRECSVVAAAYHLGGRPAGAVGIIGPTRMPYGRVIAIVSALAEALSEILSRSAGLHEA